ncbi:MAG: hypothetical protein K6B42_09320 [Clostridia bacterium]|nr:hypothetical protein [Clostridia bacterium]
MELEIRVIPEHIAYTAEYDVDCYDDFFDVSTGANDLQDLEDLMHEDNPDVVVPEIPNDYNYFTHPAGEVPEGGMHVRYYDMVDRKGRDDSEGRYRFVTVPVVRAAVMIWKGPNRTIPKGIARAFALVKEAGFEIAGDTRVSAIHGPWDREDENEYLVEIQVPVK